MPHKEEPSTDKSAIVEPGNGDQMIASTLKRFYDGLVDEGTPDGLMDLLERLDEAERKASPKTPEA
ncbi:NepR family anti-sigma factor [Rhizobium halophytocola]|uniref:Anti-sigma factor NepR domain-containing protein n=1 Tax=Rhizobium halophytocola TaxID=735519 RepID=A0ABS4E0H8_9HYPH|nr:NepR family anti-sigma factor [Rhizobium halophytocola]MBP1851440.1 hypothetical protein [Rhizobium halophytocola]